MTTKDNLKGYGQYYRSGITMKQKWAQDNAMKSEKRDAEVLRQQAASSKPMMGRNE